MNDKIEDDDWIDLEKQSGAGPKPAAAVRLYFHTGRHGTTKNATAAMVLRHAAAEWIAKNGPRFKVQIGGDNCEKVRIVPDNHGGKFEAVEFKGVQRLILGKVTVWPNEARDPTEAKWSVTKGGLVLVLPTDFAKPRVAHKPVESAPAPKPTAPAPSQPFPITTQARGLDALSKAVAQKDRRAVPFGEPAPGRSALDQRKAGQ